MIVEELVGVDRPEKIPVVEQVVVDLVEALHVAELTGGPLAVLRSKRAENTLLNRLAERKRK